MNLNGVVVCLAVGVTISLFASSMEGESNEVPSHKLCNKRVSIDSRLVSARRIRLRWSERLKSDFNLLTSVSNSKTSHCAQDRGKNIIKVHGRVHTLPLVFSFGCSSYCDFKFLLIMLSGVVRRKWSCGGDQMRREYIQNTQFTSVIVCTRDA